jgi:hypothetical protein
MQERVSSSSSLQLRNYVMFINLLKDTQQMLDSNSGLFASKALSVTSMRHLLKVYLPHP